MPEVGEERAEPDRVEQHAHHLRPGTHRTAESVETVESEGESDESNLKTSEARPPCPPVMLRTRKQSQQVTDTATKSWLPSLPHSLRMKTKESGGFVPSDMDTRQPCACHASAA